MVNLLELQRPHEGVALIRLNLAESGGFVSWKAADALAGALREGREGGARVLVLASALEGHWYEHAWLRDLLKAMRGEETSGPGKGWFQVLDELRSEKAVTIAAISGDCSGGGAEIGWACDLRVAEEQVTFSQPEVMLGITTGIGGTARLVRLIGRTAAAEMVFDGGPIPARRILELGGINRVVPTGEATQAALDWAVRIASRPPGALAALKEILLASDEKHLADALETEQRIFQRTAGSPEAREAIQKAQERFDAGDSIREVYGPPRS